MAWRRCIEEGDVDRALDYSHRQLQLLQTAERAHLHRGAGTGPRDPFYFPDFIIGMGNVAVVLASRPALSASQRRVNSSVAALAKASFGLDVTSVGDAPATHAITILNRAIATFEGGSEDRAHAQTLASALSNLGCIYDSLGDKEEAMACFGCAEKRLDPRERYVSAL
jgi:hypothetical protein